jgi:serine/threonine-protein kinase
VYRGELKKCPTDGAALTLVPDADEKLEEVPGFTLQSTIGFGSAGKVYKAQCHKTNSPVAIKILHQSLINDLETVKRFKQEIELTSRISSPHIVAIKEYGLLNDGRPYMVMDYIEGVCVSNIVEEKGAMHALRALPIFIQVAGGLAHTHAQGIMHRDIKLNNIMLINKDKERDVVKIVDFGIAKQWTRMDGNSAAPLTLAGEAVGSPLYMSPEQCLGKEIDHRTDIYSLGSVMYETLTGRSVFRGDNAFTIMTKHINEMPQSLGLPKSAEYQEIERIVMKALAKKADERYATAADLQADLEACLAALKLVV